MKKITIFLIILILATSVMSTIVYADAVTDAVKSSLQNPSGSDNDEIEMKRMAGKVLGVVQVVGYAVAVIALSIQGIKYMMASVEEKAKIKEGLTIYVIGAIILFGSSTIIGIINKFVIEAF